jgi:hypothetical protein
MSYAVRVSVLLSLILAVALVVGCRGSGTPKSAAGAAEAKDSASAPGHVLAVIDGKPVTRADLDALLAPYLAQIAAMPPDQVEIARQRMLDDIILQRLVSAEAHRRGIGDDDLFKAEIENKVPPPSDADLRAFYAKAKEIAAARNSSLPPFDRAKPMLIQLVRRNQLGARLDAYIAQLRTAAKLRVDLPPLSATELAALRAASVRKKLPFKIGGLLQNAGTFRFDQGMNPQSPPGGAHLIVDLTCDGVLIPLVSGTVHESLVTTREFGDLELVSHADGLELRGTEAQREALTKYIASHHAAQVK